MSDNSQFAKRCERIRRLIYSRPGIEGIELSRATKTLNEFERKDVIDFLVAQRTIRVEVTPTRGRPKRTYWPTPAVMPREAYSWAAGVDLDADPAKMTVDQIEAENERRRGLNE